MIKPSIIIPGQDGKPYLRRWHLVPRNRWCNIYLHQFVQSDDDRALHDHPWWSVSFLLAGSISEEVGVPDHDSPPMMYSYSRVLTQWDRNPENITPFARRHRYRIRRWRPVFRSAEFAHRIELNSDTAWTLFITGPKRRKWGFHCPDKWRVHNGFKGCG